METQWHQRAHETGLFVDPGLAPPLLEPAPVTRPIPAADIGKLMVGAAAPGYEARLGVGYNTYSGETRGIALKPAGICEQPFEGGQDVEFAIREIEQRDSLRQHLGLSASASYSGLFSVDAKASWSNDVIIDQRSLYVLILVRVTNAAMLLDRYELSEPAQAMLAGRPRDWQAFYRRYGDAFIHSLVSGGEFYALYEFKTASREDKTKIRASIKGGFGGFTSKAKFEESLQQIHSTTEISVTSFVRGGKGKLPNPLDASKLIKAALDFPAAVDPVNGAPVACRAEYRDYDVVEGFPYDEAAPFYGEVADRNRRVFARLARFHDRVRDADHLASSPLYGAVIQEKVKALTDLAESRARAMARDPCAAHDFPADCETEMAALERQLCWRQMSGNLVEIAAGSATQVWGLDKDDRIFAWDALAERWVEKPGRLATLSIGADGHVVGVNRQAQAFAWNPPGGNWLPLNLRFLCPNGKGGYAPVGGKLQQIAVGKQGVVFALSDSGGIYKQGGDGWYPLFSVEKPGEMRLYHDFSAIAAAADGSVWAIDKAGHAKALTLETYKIRNIQEIPGKPRQVSVAGQGQVWAIDADGHAARWTGSAWSERPGQFSRIAAAADGTVWALTRDGSPARLEEVEEKR